MNFRYGSILDSQWYQIILNSQYLSNNLQALGRKKNISSDDKLIFKMTRAELWFGFETEYCFTDDGDGGVQLPVVVEQGQVVHLGEGLVGVGVIGSPLHPGPAPDPISGNIDKSIKIKLHEANTYWSQIKTLT